MNIELADYDPAWPGLYERERARIVAALPGAELEHVGSTSVPGLCAKPVIDILLVVPDSSDEDAYVPALVEAGFYFRLRERGWHEHRLLKNTDPAVEVVLGPGEDGCEGFAGQVGYGAFDELSLAAVGVGGEDQAAVDGVGDLGAVVAADEAGAAGVGSADGVQDVRSAGCVDVGDDEGVGRAEADDSGEGEEPVAHGRVRFG